MLKVTSQGADSAVYDCLVLMLRSQPPHFTRYHPHLALRLPLPDEKRSPPPPLLLVVVLVVVVDGNE